MFGLHFSRLGSVNILAPINRALSFISALSNSITPQRGSAATFTRSTTATVVDQDSVVRTAKINEARFPGLRRVENLLTYSEDFNNAAWPKLRATISANVSATTAPDGSGTADKLVEDITASNSHFLYQGHTGSNETVTASVYAKAAERSRIKIEMSNFATASCGAYFDLASGVVIATDAPNADYTSPSATITLIEAGWYRCSLTVTKGSVNTANHCAVLLIAAGTNVLYTGDGTSGLYIWGAQLENVTGQSVQTVGEYVSTNVLSSPYHGAGVDGVKYLTTTLAGAPLSGKFLSEPARTNLLIRSQEFDNVAWIKLVYTVSANAVTAPDGTLTADKLDEATTASTDRYVAQYGAAITASAITTASIYVKDAGRGYCQLRLANGNGTFSLCYYSINLSTLETVTSGAIGGTFSSVSATRISNGWIRLTVSGTLAADVTFAGIQLYGYNGSITAYAGVVGTGVYAWGAQLEAGNRASSYTPTVASTVTRASDSLSYPVTASPTQGGFRCTLVPAEAPATAAMFYAVGLFGATNADVIGLYTAAGTSDLYCYVRRAGASMLNLLLGTVVAGTAYKVAISWAGTAVRASINGGAVISGTASNMPTSLSSFNNSIDTVWNGQISDVKVFTQTLSDNTLRQLTT